MNQTEQQNLQTVGLLMNNQKGGTIIVRNTGGYVAKFTLSYKLNGQEISTTTDGFTAGVNKHIDVPVGATDIHLVVLEAWFIASWSTIFSQTFAEPVDKKYVVSGTTLNPSWHEE